VRKSGTRSLDYFLARPAANWGGISAGSTSRTFSYCSRPTEKQASSWESFRAEIDTWDKLGIPEARRSTCRLGPVRDRGRLPQLQEDLTEEGVLFLDMGLGLREHEGIVKQYMGTIIPQNDNKSPR